MLDARHTNESELMMVQMIYYFFQYEILRFCHYFKQYIFNKIKRECLSTVYAMHCIYFDDTIKGIKVKLFNKKLFVLSLKMPQKIKL